MKHPDAHSTNSPSAQKRALRTAMLASRNALAATTRAAWSGQITSTLLALPDYNDANVVLAYMSMGTEFGSEDFVARVLQDGKRLVLPRIDKLSRSLVLHQVTDLCDLMAGVWGIREPRPEAPLCDLHEIDFILVPGLAFDRAGNRLGYGGGFYDQLFSRMDAAKMPQTPASTRVSAAFSTQLVDAIPVTEYDHRVHLIVTEHEIVVV